MTEEEASISSSWSREDDKAFENALATYSEDSVDFWYKIASHLPEKTLEEIKHHYDLLVDDVNNIEAGRVPLPAYNSLSDGPASFAGDGGGGKKGGQFGNVNGENNHGGKGSKAEQERRKGIAWTEEEHRLFLLGLEKYGKGDWRSISRNFVVTRTPTQVASHAQKYFIRLNSVNKDRRRSSIHDITSVNSGDSANQGPITGTGNGTGAGGASGKSSEQSPQSPAAFPAVGIYGTPTIGQPIGGSIVSAVGTPVTGHMAIGVKVPVQGSLGSSTPTSGPGTYPMQHATGHR